MASEDRSFLDTMRQLGVRPKRGAYPAAPTHTDPSEPEDSDEEDRRLFLEAMGVIPEKRETVEDPPEPEPVSERLIEPEDDSEERAVFLAAMDRLGDIQVDDQAPPRPEPPAARRPLRKKLPKKAVIDWDEQLDLHGMRLEEALKAVASFVARNYANSARIVSIVVGKGRNSPDGVGVLGPAVERWILMAGGRYVQSYADAPRHQGGRGTLILYLRKS